MNDEWERVELKIAYLERANSELSDVVYRQQLEIAALTEKVAWLASRLEAMKTETTLYTEAQERPPHY